MPVSSRLFGGLVAVLAIAALSACGSNSDSVGSTPGEMSNGTVACGSKNAPPCVPIPTTQAPALSCGGITTEILTEAIGRETIAEATDGTGCRFASGDLRLTLTVDVYNPSGIPGFGFPGANSPDQYWITNDRSGYWYATGHTAGFQWVLVSHGRGADTYPNTEGPEQRPIVSAAADAFLKAVSELQSPG